MKQANYAVADAVRKAHAKTDETKKNTLSLAGEHNKRAEDRQKPAEEAMPQVAEAALAAAAQALHDGATQGTTKAAVKEETNVENINTPRVVIRQDSRNLIYCFDVDSLSPSKKTLTMWDMTHGGQEEEVPLDFYKTLRPVTEQKQVDKTVKALTEKLGVNRIVVRARLVKNSLERDEEGKVETTDIEAWKERLIASITRAIREA